MQKFEGDLAIELFVVSGKDASHATRAELAKQDKTPKALRYLHVGGTLRSRARRIQGRLKRDCQPSRYPG